jgi:hypothetical protein
VANRITTVLEVVDTKLKSGLRSAQKSIKETEGFANKARVGFQSMWTSFTSSPTAIAGAAVAVGAATAKMVNDASNLEESVNAVNVAYGEAADGVHALGAVSAESFGLSERAFNEFSVQFSAFADKIATAGGRDVVGVLDEMTTRIADFASVNNLDMAEAAQIFQSSLAGETEALRRYGGDVSAAAVEQFALEEGLIKTKSEMTESIKVTARYGLLMKETAKTAGDFANTSDSLANQQRKLSANMEDLSASFGRTLIPIVGDAAGTVNNLIASFEDLAAMAPGGGSSGPVGGFVSGLVQPLKGLQGALDFVEESTGKLDEALGDEDQQLVENIKSWREAAEAADTWTSAHVPATRATEDLAAAQAASQGQMDLYVDGLVRAHEAAEADADALEQKEFWESKAAETAERHREAIDAVVEAMEEQLATSLELIGGDIAVRDAQRRAAEEVEGMNEVLADQESTLGEAATAIDEAAAAQLDAGRAAADYRAKQLEANGQAVDARVQQQLLKEELQKIVAQLDGPLAAALQRYLDDLNALDGRTIHTTLVLDTPGRVGDFGAPEVGGQFALNGAAGSPVINVNVTTTGEVAPSKIVDAIDKYYRFNAPR